MYILKPIFYLLVIFYTVNLEYGHCDIQDSRDAERIKNGSLFIGRRSFDKGTLLFAVCDRSLKNQAKCNVIQKVYPNSKSTYSCFVTLKGDHEESHLQFLIGVSTLGEDKAILFWGEDYNNSSIAKIGTVDLKTCKMNQITIPDPSHQVILGLYYTNRMVTYDNNSFDIFYNDTERCVSKMCKMTINADGTAKSESTISNIEGGYLIHIYPIATGSPAKGYAYLISDPMGFNLVLLKPDGTKKILEKYVKTARPTISAGKNVINACTKPSVDSDVICTEYDEHGIIKFTTTIPEIRKNTQSRALHKLTDGQILVLLAEMSNCDKLQNCDEGKYHIVKISSDGKYQGNALIKDFETVNDLQWKYTFVYKYSDSKYCAAIIGQDPIIDNSRLSNFEIIHYCVADNDFSV